MNFQSDNQSSIFPEIIKYLEEINLNSSPAYGSDKITIQANEMLSELFKIDLKVRYVSSIWRHIMFQHCTHRWR